jgi:hypothetical protein
MNKKVSIKLEFSNIEEFKVSENEVTVKFKTDGGGWELQTFVPKDVKSFYSYDETE